MLLLLLLLSEFSWSYRLKIKMIFLLIFFFYFLVVIEHFDMLYGKVIVLLTHAKSFSNIYFIILTMFCVRKILKANHIFGRFSLMKKFKHIVLCVRKTYALMTRERCRFHCVGF